jgi:hypothetical protein
MSGDGCGVGIALGTAELELEPDLMTYERLYVEFACIASFGRH